MVYATKSNNLGVLKAFVKITISFCFLIVTCISCVDDDTEDVICETTNYTLSLSGESYFFSGNESSYFNLDLYKNSEEETITEIDLNATTDVSEILLKLRPQTEVQSGEEIELTLSEVVLLIDGEQYTILSATLSMEDIRYRNSNVNGVPQKFVTESKGMVWLTYLESGSERNLQLEFCTALD